MSGAEVVAAISVVASVVQLVDASIKVVSRVTAFCRDVSEIPASLQHIKTRLPILSISLQKRISNTEALANLEDGEKLALENFLGGVKHDAEELLLLLESIFPAQDASTWRKVKMALQSFKHEKKIENVMREIDKDILILIANDVASLGKSVAVEPQFQPQPALAKPFEPLFMVGITRKDEFVGREDIMELLESKLSHEDKYNPVALVGLGGMGKTRIALEYALKFKNSQVSVFWVHASTKARIVEAYGAIAKRANLVGYEDPKTGGPNLVKNWLESKISGRWLMILDNADDRDLLYGKERLADFFPRSESGSIIMTTRDKRVGIDFAGSAQVLSLEALDTEMSQKLLESRFADELDSQSSKDLAKELEGIPLAIVQAAAFMNSNSCDVKDYLELYRESSSSKIELLSEDFEDNIRDKESPNPIAATWLISFNRIERDSPLSADMLKMMCILDPQAIPLSLIQSNYSRQDLIKAIGTLQAFGLVSIRKTRAEKGTEKQKTYDLHRLVRLSMRNWLKLRSLLYLWTAKTLKLVAAAYPSTEDAVLETKDEWAVYLPHAITLLSAEELRSDDKDSVAPVFLDQKMVGGHSGDNVPCAACTASLMLGVSRSYTYYGSRNDATALAMQSFSLRTYIFGTLNENTIESLMQAVTAEYYSKRYEEAQKLGIQALGLIGQLSNPPPQLVARSYEVRVIFCHVARQFEEAEEYCNEAIKLCTIAYGPEHLHTLEARQLLGITYVELNRNKDAEKVYRELYILCKRNRPRSSVTLSVISNLAVLLYNMGKLVESTEIALECYTLSLSVLGPYHADTILELCNMATISFRRGRLDEALKFGTQALELGSELKGPDYNMTLLTLGILGTVNEKLGCINEADDYINKLLDGCSKTLGPNHAKTLEAMHSVAWLHESRERYKKAEQIWEHLVTMQTQIHGERSTEVIFAMCDLGITYCYQGQHEKAAAYQYTALGFPLDDSEAKKASTIDRMAGLSVRLSLSGNLADAEKMARDATRFARMCKMANHTTFTHALIFLADVCHKLYGYDEAETLYREVIKCEFSDQISGCPELPRIMTSLGGTLIEQLRFKEAEETVLEARRVLLKDPYAQKSVITSNIKILASVYRSQGRYDEAEPLFFELLTEQIASWNPSTTTRSKIILLISALEDLALLYLVSSRPAKAASIYNQTLAIRTKFKGEAHIESLRIMTRLVETKNSLELFEEALALGLECKRLQKTGPGNTVRDRMLDAQINVDLARAYAGLGRYEEAEPLARDAAATSRGIVGDRNEITRESVAALGSILRGKQGEEALKEAEEIERDALTNRLRDLGQNVAADRESNVDVETERRNDEVIKGVLDMWARDVSVVDEALAELLIA